MSESDGCAGRDHGEGRPSCSLLFAGQRASVVDCGIDAAAAERTMLEQEGGGAVVNIGSTVVVRDSARAPQYAAVMYGTSG